MTTRLDLHVLRVFVGADGRHGNPLGVFLDGLRVHLRDRQQVAKLLNFSETVFVDDVADGAARIQIYTPGAQLGFAGHPTVGTSWLLRHEGKAVERLEVPAGEVAVWQDGDLAWIRARAAWVHPITIHEYATADEVDALSGPPPPRRPSTPGPGSTKRRASCARATSRAGSASPRTRRPARPPWSWATGWAGR